MARLGSGDSPVSGQEFELPAGAQLAEDSGDLVIQDSGGNVVFRRDEANGEWVGDSLSIDEATIGKTPSGRPLISNADKTINVPGDYNTIQKAVDAIPLICRHRWIIEVDNGTYDEDVVIRSVQAPDWIEATDDPYSGQGENGTLTIVGDDTTPSNVQVNSITTIGCTGGIGPEIIGFEFTGGQPYFGEQCSVMVNGCHWVAVAFCKFSASIRQGITYYGSNGKIADNDFGSSNLTNAFYIKSGSQVHSTRNSGTVTDQAYVSAASLLTFDNDSISYSGDVVKTFGQGLAMNNNTLYPRQDGGASAYLSTTQSVPDTTTTKVAYDAVNYDQRTEFDTSNGTFTADKDGIYQVKAMAKAGVSDQTEMALHLMVNGSKAASASKTASGSPYLSVMAAKDVQLSSGDTVTAEFWHNDGSSIDLLTGDNTTYITVSQIAPA